MEPRKTWDESPYLVGLVLFLFLLLGALGGCAGLTLEQQQTAAAGLKELLDKGVISLEQYRALLEALQGSGWTQFLELLATGASTLLASLWTVWKIRGGIRNRRGLPPQ